ncbi:conserved hypothetical protein [Arthrobacter sp. Hiyo4]|nr:conserved hypothetical protein [Arthrobacter sp. Hiyo4]
MVKAVWNDTVIAESDNTVVVEGNHYFPRQSVKSQYLTDSEMYSVCPWKGGPATTRWKSMAYGTSTRPGSTQNPSRGHSPLKTTSPFGAESLSSSKHRRPAS